VFVPTMFCGKYSGSTSSYEQRMNAEEFELVKPVFNAYLDQLGAYLVAPEKSWQ
jgi:hypothetical protein